MPQVYCPTCARRNGIRQLCPACKAQLSDEPVPTVWIEWPNRRVTPLQVLGWNASRRYSTDEPVHKQLTSPCGLYIVQWWDRDERRPELVVQNTETKQITTTLTRNSYRLELNGFAVHWFQTDEQGTMLLYNPSHGVLSLVDPRTGTTVASQQSKVSDYFIFEVLTTSDPRKLVVCGWNWHPLLAGWLFDLDEMLTKQHKYRMTRIYDEWSLLHGKVHDQGLFVYGVAEQSQWVDDSDEDESSTYEGADDSPSESSESKHSSDSEDAPCPWLDEPVPPPIDTLYSWERVRKDDRLCVNNLVVQVVQPNGKISEKPPSPADGRDGYHPSAMEELGRVDQQVIPHLVARD